MSRTILHCITLSLIVASFSCSSHRPSGNQSAASTRAEVKKLPKSQDGIYAPGVEELNALKAQFPEITIECLNQGYVLYSKGACINCHEAKSIYEIGIGQWRHVVDEMAPKAELNAYQKDALMKFILSIKATQPAAKG